jgi:protein SCO1/2
VTRRLLFVFVVAVLALAGCSSSHSSSPSSAPSASALNDQSGGGPYQGIGLTPPQPRPAFTLTDTAGRPFSFGTATAGHPTLLYFGYTNCPDICPETFANIALALQKVPTALQASVDVVFVTTDIKRDTGPAIAQWLGHFSAGQVAHFIGLRGTQAQIDVAQAAAHVTLAQDAGQTHSAEVLLYGADNYARVSYAYNGASEQTEIAHDLPLVAKT